MEWIIDPAMLFDMGSLSLSLSLSLYLYISLSRGAEPAGLLQCRQFGLLPRMSELNLSLLSSRCTCDVAFDALGCAAGPTRENPSADDSRNSVRI